MSDRPSRVSAKSEGAGLRLAGGATPLGATKATSSGGGSSEAEKVRCVLEGDTLRIVVGGVWKVRDARPDVAALWAQYCEASVAVKTVVLEDGGIDSWDSALPVFLRAVMRQCEGEGVEFDFTRLPKGLVRLLDLATLAPKAVLPEPKRQGFLELVGLQALKVTDSSCSVLTFVGEVSLALLRVLTGRGVFRSRDFFVLIEACGYHALPIVALISFLVGLIMAFVGAVQLAPFGADIYVANLVGVAMVREMGAVMCAMVMAGRTGAAFAAQIGSMKVTEEIDALKTQGISPTEFLVVPRLFALLLMMPFLCVFADIIGILGGLVVSLAMLDVTAVQYINQTAAAIDPLSFLLGILKAGVFGIIIACAGCLRGMECGNSSSSVGDAATSAVVTSITLVVIADALFAVTFNILGV